MRLSIAAAVMLGFCGTAFAECPVADIEKALNLPLDGLSVSEQEVEDIQSTEGGVWRIYRREDGNVQSIVRIDGGESGMSERRLGIHSMADYGITVTRVGYLRHAFIEEGGPNGTVKRSTEYFYFCGGKLHVPPEQFATVDVKEYAKAGEEAQALMLGSKEIAEATKGLKR
jgi:hypothetical protein